MQQLEKITALLDEITELRTRLQTINPASAAIEMALLEKLSIELYRQIQKNKNEHIQKNEISSPRRLSPVTAVKTADIDRKKEKLLRDEPAETLKQAPVQENVKETPKTVEKQPEPITHKEHISSVYAQAREKAAAHPQPAKTVETVKNVPVVEKVTSPEAQETASQKEASQSLHEKLRGQSQSSSINEKFAQQQVKRNLADKLKLSPINDLRTAININQKVAFTKQLFKGDDKEFKRVLNFINDSKNFSEAKFYLQTEIGESHDWKDDDPVVQEFMELVYRKFL